MIMGLLKLAAIAFGVTAAVMVTVDAFLLIEARLDFQKERQRGYDDAVKDMLHAGAYWDSDRETYRSVKVEELD